MRYAQISTQPSWKRKKRVNLIGQQPVERQKLLRVAEVLTLLGFLHSVEYFADFHLALEPDEAQRFVHGETHWVEPSVVEHLRLKLNAVHDVLAKELANSDDEHERWLAQCRYNLLQIAYAHII